ncbi:MAG: DUF547 domain-containing protein [Candidatus Promineifilaceae bacterium]
MINDEALDTANISRALVQSGSSFSDMLIRGREFLLDMISGVDDSRIVNRHVAAIDMQPSADLAQKLKQTLDDLKISVMDANGAKVDYQALRVSSAYAAYHEECLAVLDRFNPADLTSTEARRAFWINLYNALVMDAVIDLGIQRSVTEGRLGLLTFFRRAAYSVNGKRVSLDDIEHGILRGNRGNPYVPGVHFSSGDQRLRWALSLDPRIHFALNCGGRSCPPIRSYSPDRLNEQLDIAARSFVDSTVATRPESGEVLLSKIFRWYEKDFGGRENMVDFLINYLPEDERRDYLVAERGYIRLRYNPYDWGLNAR